MRELKYNIKQVRTQEIIHAIVKVHAIVEKIAGVNGSLMNCFDVRDHSHLSATTQNVYVVRNRLHG